MLVFMISSLYVRYYYILFMKRCVCMISGVYLHDSLSSLLALSLLLFYFTDTPPRCIHLSPLWSFFVISFFTFSSLFFLLFSFLLLFYFLLYYFTPSVFFLLIIRRPPRSPRVPYTTLFLSLPGSHFWLTAVSLMPSSACCLP